MGWEPDDYDCEDECDAPDPVFLAMDIIRHPEVANTPSGRELYELAIKRLTTFLQESDA